MTQPTTPSAPTWVPTPRGLFARSDLPSELQRGIVWPRERVSRATTHADAFRSFGDADSLWRFLLAGDTLRSEDAFRRYLEEASGATTWPWLDDPAALALLQKWGAPAASIETGRPLFLPPSRLLATRPIIVRGATTRAAAPEAGPAAAIDSARRDASDRRLDLVAVDTLDQPAAEFVAPTLHLVAQADTAIFGRGRSAEASGMKRKRWVAAGLAAAGLVAAILIALPFDAPRGLAETTLAPQSADASAMPFAAASAKPAVEPQRQMSAEFTSFTQLVPTSGPAQSSSTTREPSIALSRSRPVPTKTIAASPAPDFRAMAESGLAVTGTAVDILNRPAPAAPAPITRTAALDLPTAGTRLGSPKSADTKAPKHVAKRRKAGTQATKLASAARLPIGLPDALRPQ